MEIGRFPHLRRQKVENLYLSTSGSVCTRDHFAPRLRVLRSVQFNQYLSSFWASETTTASAVYDAVFEEIYEHRIGTCYSLVLNDQDEEVPLDFDVKDQHGDCLLDRSFGQDPERTINRYLGRSKRRYRNRLSKSLYLPVLLLHYAREIRVSRSSS